MSKTDHIAASLRLDGLSDNLKGALWLVASGFAATVMSVAIRELAPTIDSRMLAFIRSGFGALVALPWLLDGSWRRLRFSRPWLHLSRGALMGVALNLGFYSIAVLPLTTATILFFLAPVFATALAGPVLGEQVGPRRWGAVAAGFLGAAIILRPGFGALELGMLAAVGSALCFSWSLMVTKILGPADGARSVLISSTVVSALVTLPIALPVWTLPVSLGPWLWIAALVGFSSIRMYADIRAYAVGEAGFLAPFSYLRLLFAAAAGWLLFREGLDLWTLLGGAVIVGATLYIAQRESRLKRRVAPPAA